jgi:hypothetical protein
MATEEKEKTLEYVDGYTDEITDELTEDGGTAVAQVPEKEIEYNVDLVDNENNIEFEVETEPAPEPEPYEETVTETVTEEVTYGPDYNRGYGYDRGYGYNRGYNRGRTAYRRCNKHIFTWVFSFVLGMYGVDRFARGQIGLGLLKMLTFGGFGFWYMADLGVALYKSYMAPDAMTQEDLHFDSLGRYV